MARHERPQILKMAPSTSEGGVSPYLGRARGGGTPWRTVADFGLDSGLLRGCRRGRLAHEAAGDAQVGRGRREARPRDDRARLILRDRHEVEELAHAPDVHAGRVGQPPRRRAHVPHDDAPLGHLLLVVVAVGAVDLPEELGARVQVEREDVARRHALRARRAGHNVDGRRLHRLHEAGHVALERAVAGVLARKVDVELQQVVLQRDLVVGMWKILNFGKA